MFCSACTLSKSTPKLLIGCLLSNSRVASKTPATPLRETGRVGLKPDWMSGFVHVMPQVGHLAGDVLQFARICLRRRILYFCMYIR
jgi:hypothetical protein